MSVSDTAAAAAAARRHSAPFVRDAVPADYPAIRRVVSVSTVCYGRAAGTMFALR